MEKEPYSESRTIEIHLRSYQRLKLTNICNKVGRSICASVCSSYWSSVQLKRQIDVLFMEKEPYSESRTMAMHLRSYHCYRRRAMLSWEIRIKERLQQSWTKYLCFCV